MPKKRTTNRDHAKRQQRPMMEDEEIAAQLSELVTPALIAQEKSYRQLGMRDRILVTRLPVEIWFQEKATASDMKFESDILNLVKPQTLILLDRGFCHYQFWQQLIAGDVHLITRLNNKA